MIAEPPSFAGAVHVATKDVPLRTNVTLRGTVGTNEGVTVTIEAGPDLGDGSKTLVITLVPKLYNGAVQYGT